MGKQTESRGKYLAKNTAIFALGNVATKLITFFLVPLYTNILTTAEYGTVDLINTLCTVLAPILILNIGESVMRFALDKDADYDKIMSIGLAIMVCSIFVGFLIIPVSSCFKTVSDYSILVYLYTISFAASQLFLSYLRGTERLFLYSIGNIVHTFAIAVLNIIFLTVLHKGVEGYFIAYIISNIVTVLYAFIVGDVKQVIKNYNLDIKLTKAMTKYSVVLIPNTFMWWITNSSDRLMVTSMIGVAANGIYAVSYKLPSLVNTISVIFNQAWNYSAIRENDSKDRDDYNNRVYDVVVAASVISGVGLMAIMKIFMKVYVAQNYYEAWRYTPYLIVGYVFLTLATFIGTSYSVNKDGKGFLFSGLTGASVNIILNFILIPCIGIAGAALATCISYIVIFIYRSIDTRKYVMVHVLNKKHLISFIVMLAVAVTMFWDSIYGQLLLFLGLFLEMCIFKDIWLPLTKRFIQKVRR